MNFIDCSVTTFCAFYRVLLSLIGFAILLGTVYDVFIYQPSVENAKSSLGAVAGKRTNLIFNHFRKFHLSLPPLYICSRTVI